MMKLAILLALALTGCAHAPPVQCQTITQRWYTATAPDLTTARPAGVSYLRLCGGRIVEGGL